MAGLGHVEVDEAEAGEGMSVTDGVTACIDYSKPSVYHWAQPSAQRTSILSTRD